jgi:hypothetical protein
VAHSKEGGYIMISSFNKKTSIITVVFLCILLMAGCSSTKKTQSNNSANTSTNSATSSSDNSATNSTSDNSSSSNASSSNDTLNEKGTQNSSQIELIKNIKTLALEGKAINCDLPAKYTSIQTVQSKYGKEDRSDWVAQAKGTYFTYSKENLVFGVNRDQVFEVRSFDARLKQISLSTVKSVLGTPAYNATSDGNQIIGYVDGTDFKILFVFSKSENGSSPMLDHYSVLYPKGTVNNMGNDPGRQW